MWIPRGKGIYIIFNDTHFCMFQIVKFLKKNCLVVCGIYQALLRDTSGEVQHTVKLHWCYVTISIYCFLGVDGTGIPPP